MIQTPPAPGHRTHPELCVIWTTHRIQDTPSPSMQCSEPCRRVGPPATASGYSEKFAAGRPGGAQVLQQMPANDSKCEVLHARRRRAGGAVWRWPRWPVVRVGGGAGSNLGGRQRHRAARAGTIKGPPQPCRATVPARRRRAGRAHAHARWGAEGAHAQLRLYAPCAQRGGGGPHALN